MKLEKVVYRSSHREQFRVAAIEKKEVVGPAGKKTNQSPTKKAEVAKDKDKDKGKTPDKKVEKKPEKPPADPPIDIFGVSPLKAQKIWPKGNLPIQSPVKIIPIDGRYVGMKWEIGGPNSWLGIAVDEVSQSYGADWTPNAAGTYAPGVSFSKLTEQKFSLKASFFDLKQDISHLTEGLKHLMEISGATKQPPILIYIQGDMQCHVVLTSVKVDYAEPLGGSRGFKQAKSVDLEFLVVAGPGSGNALLGGALTSTPQAQIAASKTDKQRLREGTKALVDNALAKCLGKASRDSIGKLIETDKLEDVSSLLALDEEAFVTLAVAGKIPATSLNSNPQLKARLTSALATFMAARENGVARDRGGSSTGSRAGLGKAVTRELAAYYTADDLTAGAALSGVDRRSRDLASAAPNGREAYRDILAGILAGNLDTNTAVQDETKPAFQKLKIFSCAQQLGKANLSTIVGKSDANDPQTIVKMNTFIDKHKAKAGADIDEYKKAFGLTDEGQVLRLIQILPSSSRADFEAKVNQKFGSGSGISGAALFSKFTGYTPPTGP